MCILAVHSKPVFEDAVEIATWDASWRIDQNRSSAWCMSLGESSTQTPVLRTQAPQHRSGRGRGLLRRIPEIYESWSLRKMMMKMMKMMMKMGMMRILKVQLITMEMLKSSTMRMRMTMTMTRTMMRRKKLKRKRMLKRMLKMMMTSMMLMTMTRTMMTKTRRSKNSNSLQATPCWRKLARSFPQWETWLHSVR